MVLGGADVVYEFAGKDRSIDYALRFTKNKGKVKLLDVVSFPRGFDWTPIWFNELEVNGRFACSTEEDRNKRIRTYPVALNLMQSGNP